MALSLAPARYLSQLEEVLRSKLGHSLPERRLRQVADTVQSLASASGYPEVGEYLDLVSKLPVHAPMAQALIKTVTNKESYFFRDAPALSALKHELLPRIITQNASSRLLRIWSAGCSTGEEIYTISIMLQELIPDYERWTVALVATDVDGDAMSFARRAEYKPWSLRATPEDERYRYFQHDPIRNVFQLRGKFRQNVSFGLHNLVDENQALPAPGAFDLILCRNVSIYFDEDGQAALARKFQRALAPQGVWVSGPSDPRPAQPFDTKVEDGLVTHRVAVASATALQLQAPDSRTKRTSRRPLTRILSQPPSKNGNGPASSQPKSSLARARMGSSLESYLAPPIDSGEDSGEPVTMVPSGTYSATENLLNEARGLADAGSFERAHEALARVSFAYPLEGQVYLLRAMILQAQGRKDEAVSDLKKAIYLDPSDADAHLRLGLLLGETGDKEGALRAFRTTGLILSAIEAPSPEQSAQRNAAAAQLVRLLREVQS